jgi:hypothetical protein
MARESSDNTVMYLALAAAAYLAYEYFYTPAVTPTGPATPPPAPNPGPVAGPPTVPPPTGQTPQTGPSAPPPSTLVTDRLAAFAVPYGGLLNTDQWVWYMRQIAGKDDSAGAAEFHATFAAIPDRTAPITLSHFIQNGGSDFWRVLTSTALSGFGLRSGTTGGLSAVVRGRRSGPGLTGYLDVPTASPVRLPLNAAVGSTWGS